jgi:hypothetical protein
MATATSNPNERPRNTIVRVGERVVILRGPYARKAGVARTRSAAGCYVEVEDVPAHRWPFVLLRDLVGERELERLKGEQLRKRLARTAAAEEEE